jgi:exosome complex component CSL4
MVIVDVLRVEGRSREVTGENQASIHVSKISETFTSNIWKEYRLGDIIRANVEQTTPSLQLSTKQQRLGVILALCTKCRRPLLKSEKALFCKRCERVEIRKLAPDYGNYQPGK